MRRSGSRRNEPEPDQHPEDPQPGVPQPEAPRPPSEGPVEQVEAPPAEPEEQGDPRVSAAEKMQGRLVELQAKLREHLDYDQIAEVRLALGARESEIEKHIKKANDLGVREEDARRRLRLIRGSDTRFGLLRIFAPEETTEQTDVFFDPEKANGRPDADGLVEDEALAAETGTVRDGWDQGGQHGSKEGADRIASITA